MATIGIGFIIILITVAMHYEGLRLLAKYADIENHRIHSFVLMTGLTILHFLEVAIYTLAFYFLNVYTDVGGITSSKPLLFLDYFILSLTNYTTLSVSDMKLEMSFKLLSGMEGLNGFMLLTWSASFLYRGAGRFWNENRNHQ